MGATKGGTPPDPPPTAVHAERAHGCAGVERHGLEDVRDLVGHGADRGKGDVLDARAEGQPHDGATGGRVPVWRSEAHEGRHDHDTVVALRPDSSGDVDSSWVT